VVVGTQLRSRAELHNLTHSRPALSFEARGTSADPAPAIDSPAAFLAPAQLASSGGTRPPIPAVAATSPRAFAAYLVGESLARQGKWQEAADSLLVSIGIDSTFGLAYYRLEIANSFGANTASWSRPGLIAAGLRFSNRLPPRQRDLLTVA